MRSYLLTAAILAASVCAPPAGAPLAEEIHQPGAAPSVSTDANYNEDTWQTVLPYQGIQAVLGKEVRSSAEENLGRIVDVLVDQSGQVLAAVIDFGGFLGVGARRIVVDWKALHFAPADQRDRITLDLTRDQIRAAAPADQRDRITLDLTRDQIRAAPEYKAGKPVIVLTAVPEM